MGSFGSKKRSSSHGNNGNGSTACKSDATPHGRSRSVPTPTRTDATSDENAKVGSANQERSTGAKAVQSFGWLVETKIDLHPTANRLNYQARKPGTEGRGKVMRNVMTYSNGKYLKSAELVSTPSNTKPNQGIKQKFHAGSLSSSSYSQYARNDGRGFGAIKAERPNQQMNTGQKDKEGVPTAQRPGDAYPAGFGVIPQKD